jgi:hypothetical protein
LPHPEVAGLLHPAADSGVHRVSWFVEPSPRCLYPSKKSPRSQPYCVTAALTRPPLVASGIASFGFPGLRVFLRARVRHARPIVRSGDVLSFLGFCSRLRSFCSVPLEQPRSGSSCRSGVLVNQVSDGLNSVPMRVG